MTQSIFMQQAEIGLLHVTTLLILLEMPYFDAQSDISSFQNFIIEVIPSLRRNV